MSGEFGIVIPARYASTRLLGKPLRLIAGQPMIQWVVQSAQRAGAAFVWVATDDERIEQAAREFGAEVVMTSPEHPTGTDRLAEVVDKRAVPADTVIVNVQGDEPLLPPEAVRLAAATLLEHPSAGIATLAHPITNPDELFHPNAVKLVMDRAGRALYFSRAPIPWVRDAFASGKPQDLPPGTPFLRHVGLYAYRAEALRRLAALPQCDLERAESLEQLRALHAGIEIRVAVVQEALPPGVDSEKDLERVEGMLLAKSR
jgi:3-deoxy-manno-octulosonate cytidylyltransferase (CMP-KDO synthetase)